MKKNAKIKLPMIGGAFLIGIGIWRASLFIGIIGTWMCCLGMYFLIHTILQDAKRQDNIGNEK